MKKKLAIILAVLALLSFCACTFEKPEEKASAFLDAVKNQDNEILSGYVDNEYVNLMVNAKGDEKVLKEIKTALFKNMSYEITASEETDEGTVLTVKVTNLDFSNVIKDYDAQSYSYIIDNLYSGSLDRKKLNGKCLDILNKAVKQAVKEKKKFSREVKVTLTENDHHAYDLKVDNKLMDALSGGFISGMKKK